MFWGGLRGSLSMALALSLPIALEERQFIIVMVFGVVLFTLIVQGLSISKLISWLKLADNRNDIFKYEMTQGQLIACNTAIEELEKIFKNGEIAENIYNMTKKHLLTEKEIYSKEMADHYETSKELVNEQQIFIEKFLIETKKDKINYLYLHGTISEEVHHSLESAFNEEMETNN